MHLLTWEDVDEDKEDLKIRLEQDVVVSKYAILSHRWGNPADEVSFRDMVTSKPENKKRYSKLVNCCKQAQRDGFQYVWIDTCCIDKSSSAELSEAINSMYQWYENSGVCYVYLEDFDGTEATLENLGSCQWFTRGWTLQELLAPREVIFLNKSWGELGTRRGLATTISTITGIPLNLFEGSSPRDCTVAQRFSWAAERQTTRSEDIAYCLLGLFDVNLAPIYGEGRVKAFIRLQEEILKRYDDQSIFIWTPGHEPRNLGLMATSPSSFCKHKGCFEWLYEAVGAPTHPFDPYEHIEPAGYYADQAHRNSAGYIGSYVQMLRRSGTQVITPVLGPQGLQVSLLVQEEFSFNLMKASESTLAGVRVTICFDLIVKAQNIYGSRPLLHMVFDSIHGFDSQNTSRRGLVHRVPALLGKQALYHLRSERPSYQRHTLCVSQQFPTEQAQNPVKFVLEELPTATTFIHYCLYDARHGEEAITRLPCVINCKGVIISFNHGCSKTANNSPLPFIVAFGIHGRRPSPWCHIMTSARKPFTEDDARNLPLNFYLILESRSGYFRNTCFRKLPCEHNVRARLSPHEELNSSVGFRFTISIGEFRDLHNS